MSQTTRPTDDRADELREEVRRQYAQAATVGGNFRIESNLHREIGDFRGKFQFA